MITGANRGIGLALTSELIHGGHRVVAATRNPAKADELKELRKEHGELLEVVELDVTSDESVKAAARDVGRLVDRLDVLVNNAAVFPEEGDESIFDMKLEHFREAFEANVLGVVRVTTAFFALLEKGPTPRIVNISSGAGSVTDKEDHGYYAYSASKSALNMLTRGLAAEFRPKGVCVVAMTPGWVKTDMGGSNAPLTPEESARSIAKTITTLTMEKTSLFIERTGSVVKYGW